MPSSPPRIKPRELRPMSGGQHPVQPRPAHRYTTPTTREMTRAETEAQCRLVRASVLARPF